MSSFKPDFEKDVNYHMGTGSSSRSSIDKQHPEMHSKQKGKAPQTPDLEQAQDWEFSEKQDGGPPRFSTLFEKPQHAAPAPQPQSQVYIEAPREHRRRGGLFVSWPIIILVLATVVIETLIIFAYTIIGLYNNAPSRLMPWAGPGYANMPACDCGAKQPSVNIAPNFVIPGPAEPSVETITVTRDHEDQLTTSVSTLTTTATATVTTTAVSTATVSAGNDASQAAAMASEVVGMLSSLTSSTTSTSSSTSTSSTTSSTPSSDTSSPSPSKSIKLITVTPPQETVKSTLLLTVDPSGNPIPTRSTVTSTKFIDPTTTTGSQPTTRAEANAPILPVSDSKTTVTTGAEDSNASTASAGNGLFDGVLSDLTKPVDNKTGTSAETTTTPAPSTIPVTSSETFTGPRSTTVLL